MQYEDNSGCNVIHLIPPVTVISMAGGIFLFTDSRENGMIRNRVYPLFAVV